eukprot:scaffold3717_cov124-Isochrysis_galbana.AAC.12
MPSPTSIPGKHSSGNPADPNASVCGRARGMPPGDCSSTGATQLAAAPPQQVPTPLSDAPAQESGCTVCGWVKPCAETPCAGW